MYNCPHCQKATISMFSKFFTGPAITNKCSNCHEGWSTSWISMLWLLLLLISNYLTNDLSLIMSGAFVCIMGIVFFTPIKKR